MSGALEIPELGVRIAPGPACEGFVTNVEGVLSRVEQIVTGTLLWAEGDERDRAVQLLDEIVRAKNGTFPLTLILQDPRGNSAIVSDNAKKGEYRAEPE